MLPPAPVGRRRCRHRRGAMCILEDQLSAKAEHAAAQFAAHTYIPIYILAMSVESFSFFLFSYSQMREEKMQSTLKMSK